MKTQKQIHKESNGIIDYLGGTSEVAAMFNIKPPSVTKWRYGTGIPEARLMYLKIARPDAFKKKRKPG